MLHSTKELELIELWHLPLKAMRSLLDCSIKDISTRDEMVKYYTTGEKILDGMILSPRAKIDEQKNEKNDTIEKFIRMCNDCKNSLTKKSLPDLSIANGFCINLLPEHLKPLSPADLALTAPVFINASIHVYSKHSKGGQTFLNKHAMLIQNDALILEKNLPRRLETIPSHVNIIFTSKYTKKEKISSMRRDQINVDKSLHYLH